MGGCGSGNYWRQSKETTDDHFTLDVRHLQKNGWLTPVQTVDLNWSRNGNVVASIQIQTLAQRLILKYRSRAPGGDWRQMEYPVDLEWTGCHYGGHRAWFLCPANGCGRRVAMLYIGSAGIFACRHCYRLASASQRENTADRAIRQADKIRAQLGWRAGILNGTGGKPKGMHWRTYIRLLGLHNIYVSKSVDAMKARIGRLESLVEQIKG
jgi:hypothetical protein